MKAYGLILGFCMLCVFACSEDDSHKEQYINKSGPSMMALEFSSFVGTNAASEPISKYLYDLNVLLFKKNTDNVLELLRYKLYTESEIDNLDNGTTTAEPGYTEVKKLTFDSLPTGSYTVVMVGNVYGKKIETIDDVKTTWLGLGIGQSINDISIGVAKDSIPNMLFYGSVSTIEVSPTLSKTYHIELMRKVGMLQLVLNDMPQGVIDSAKLTLSNVSNEMFMTGTFAGKAQEYKTFNIAGATVDTLQLMALPTPASSSSPIELILYRNNGNPIVINSLPVQQIVSNTINNLVATVNSTTWTVNLNLNLSLQTQWRVDQENPVEVD